MMPETEIHEELNELGRWIADMYVDGRDPDAADRRTIELYRAATAEMDFILTLAAAGEDRP